MPSREPAVRSLNLYRDNISYCTIKEIEESNKTQITNDLVHSLISGLSSTVKSVEKGEKQFFIVELTFKAIYWDILSFQISSHRSTTHNK